MKIHPWKPITDLPKDWSSLARPDLDELLQVWRAERQYLDTPERARKFEEQLATRWSIETGVIERLYTIDRGTTESLVELGLGAIEQFSTTGRLTRDAARLIEDQRAALDFVFAYIKDDRPLTLSYIRELHQLLMRNQTYTDAVDQFGNRFQAEVIRGAWKTHPNNPTTVDGSIHEYAPPLLVQQEMEQLVTLHQQHLVSGVRPEVEAAWLHHRFTQIHPFQDGNGRVARTLATMIFLKAGFMPLVIRDDEHREAYLNALEQADDGHLRPLVILFANLQATDLYAAIQFIREPQGLGIGAIGRAAADVVKRRVADSEAVVSNLTKSYVDLVYARLTTVSNELKQAFAEVDVALDATVFKNTDTNEDWWRSQIVTAAKEYRYYADLSRPKRWVQLRLTIPAPDASRWNIIASFHHKAPGIMAAAVFLTTSDTGDVEDRPVILGSKTEFTYSRKGVGTDQDFQAWLDSAITAALADWQKRL